MKPMAHVFKAAIIIFFCHTPLSAHAANWVEASVAVDKSTVFIDIGSLRRTGSKVKVWELKKFVDPQSLLDSTQKKYLSMKTLWVYDCNERTAAILSYVMYSDSYGNGKIIDSYDGPEILAEYTNIVPDSVGENVLDKVCAKSAK